MQTVPVLGAGPPQWMREDIPECPLRGRGTPLALACQRMGVHCWLVEEKALGEVTQQHLAVCSSYPPLGERMLPGPSGSVPCSGWHLQRRRNSVLPGVCRGVSRRWTEGPVLPARGLCVCSSVRSSVSQGPGMGMGTLVHWASQELQARAGTWHGWCPSPALAAPWLVPAAVSQRPSLCYPRLCPSALGLGTIRRRSPPGPQSCSYCRCHTLQLWPVGVWGRAQPEPSQVSVSIFSCPFRVGVGEVKEQIIDAPAGQHLGEHQSLPSPGGQLWGTATLPFQGCPRGWPY